MSISMLDNISYKGQKPDNARSQFSTIAEMVSFSENYLPEIYITLNAETGKQYMYKRSNSVDSLLGKWREVGGDVSTIDTYTKTEIDAQHEDVNEKIGDITTLFSDQLSNTVSAINVVYGLGTDTFEYANRKLTITRKNGATKEIDISSVITDANIGELSNIVLENLEDTDVLTYDLATDKWKNSKIDLASVLEQAKTYTDKEINNSEKSLAIGCDAKPVYDSKAGTITYIQNGEQKSIAIEEAHNWFYCTSGTGVIQTRWINGIEFTIDVGAINMSEYVKKDTDVTSTFEENPIDLTKVPNLEYMKSLRLAIMTEVSKKINLTDIVNDLLSEAIDKPLSANQGRLLKEEVDKKLSIKQSTANSGKILKVGNNGNIEFVEDGGDLADNISYQNSNYPSWTNVKKALDGIMAKIDYIKPEITSFTSTAQAIYEVGQKVSNITFNWTLNKNITSQSLTDCSLANANVRTATYTNEISSNKTFTLTVGDGQNTVSKSVSISFRNKIYYGSAVLPSDFDSAFILGLSKNQFATGKSGNFSITVGSNEYGFIAFPSSFGTLSSVKIGGFDTDVISCGNISFTNSSNGVATYSIYRTGRHSLGAITMVIN